MKERVHMCADISGLLKQSKRMLGGMFTDNGERVPADKARDWLRLQLAQGKRVIPIGDCDNFDFQTGCKGHPVDDNL